MSWIAVGIGAAVGAAGGAIVGSEKGGDDVWKGALLGGVLGAAGGGIGGAAFGGAGAAAEGAAGAGVGEAALGAGAVEGGSGLALGGAGLETGGAMGLGGVGAETGAVGAGAGGFGGTAPAGGVFGAGATESSVAGGALANGSSFGGTAGGAAMGNTGGGFASTAGTAGTAGNAGTGGLSGWWGGLSSLEKAGITTAGTVGLGALINQDNKQYGVPEEETYSGPLSKIKYDPANYTPTYATPNVYRARYAEGGIAALAGGGDTMDPIGNTIYPQSQQMNTAFATSPQMPNSMHAAMAADYDAKTNPMTGEALPMGFANGGISSLGGYSDGGQLLKGPGDGVSDSIPAAIGRRQPARLADGEFVIPARAVSELGNGSTDAGAKQLYSMLDRIDKKRKKGKGLAYQSNPKKMMPA